MCIRDSLEIAGKFQLYCLLWSISVIRSIGMISCPVNKFPFQHTRGALRYTCMRDSGLRLLSYAFFALRIQNTRVENLAFRLVHSPIHGTGVGRIIKKMTRITDH